MEMAQQLYAQMVPEAQQILGKPVPPQLSPDFIPRLQSIADAYAPATVKEGFTLGAGQTRYGSDGKVLASAPAAAPKDPEAIATLKALQGDPQLMAAWQQTHPRAQAGGGGMDTFAKNKTFADQLRASGAISTPEEYNQVLTTGKVQQSDADVHLSPADEQLAQGLANYATLPSSLGRSKNRGAIIARAMQINPDYNEAQSK